MEDEDEAYERIRQSDIDDEFAYELALAAASRAQGAGRLTAGLLRQFGVRYEDLRRYNAQRAIDEGTEATKGSTYTYKTRID